MYKKTIWKNRKMSKIESRKQKKERKKERKKEGNEMKLN